MANFIDAYNITAKNEGGYDPGTNEAETAFGVDRGANPHWTGWAIVDEVKKGKTTAQINAALRNNKDFMSVLVKFYAANYWNPLWLSEVVSQAIANCVYDCAVNQGVGIAAKLMQTAAGVTVDGVVGSKTIAAVNAGDAEKIFNEINQLREYRYKRTKGGNVWLKVWLARLVKYEPNI